MRSYIYFLIVLLISTVSCTSTDLQKEFSCGSSSYSNLSKTKDIRNLFSVQLPKNWKVNIYYDDGQSSIYAADTTLSLTKTTLIDVSYIHASVFFDTDFKQKLSVDNKNMGLEEIKTKDLKHLDKVSYLSIAQGEKGNYKYHILNVFTKIDNSNFLHAKTEFYGDSLVNERICKAVNLIDKIELK
ncbi:hypothetical protein SAMN04489761_0424 [Tenacibaculum sp. MAR_2009_124]|uniref:hypothetical protein n=1 Tax=Tenacibaculum sp. MAR_2009_124 TaxID=1250059 RepID=UPI000899D35E|nr:hypothetical protein [Tenacibaculum sp. MAR_2009_124]SEB39530.1 hypothetical protein SAMN04489761_0424 [Tenacibaculum sp. MAR_2009_124]